MKNQYNETLTIEGVLLTKLDNRNLHGYKIVEKVKGNKDFASKFKDDPIKAVESVVGVDIPDGAADKIVDGVKAKIGIDGVKDKVGGLLGKLGL